MKVTPPPEVEITLESRVELRDLVVSHEPGQKPLLGCPEVRRYVEADAEFLAAVAAIRRAGTLAEAEALLLEETGEEFDLVDLAGFLRARDMVRAVDGVEIPLFEQEARARHPLLHAVKPERVRWMRHPLTAAVVLALTALWVWTMIRDPSLAPRYADFFVTGRPGVDLLAVFVGLLLVAYAHELAHFFVARSYGVDATIALSHRFYILVLQTDVTNAWTLPARQRAVVFLAGITLNFLLASTAGLLAYGVTAGFVAYPVESVGYLKFFINLNLFPVVYQLFVFARTDLYYLLAIATKERNLTQDSLSYMWFRIRRGTRRLLGADARRRYLCPGCDGDVIVDDPFCLRCGTKLPVPDPHRFPFAFESRRKLTAYGAFLIAGGALAYAYFLLVFVTLGTGFLTAALEALSAATATGSVVQLMESLLVLLVLAAQIGLILYFLSRGASSAVNAVRRARARRAAAAAAGTTTFEVVVTRPRA